VKMSRGEGHLQTSHVYATRGIAKRTGSLTWGLWEVCL
jgi:hypothetical protein